MNFTITTLARSLAEYLAPFLPGVQMLEDPAQQGVEPPCMFIQQRGSNGIRQTIDGTFQRIVFHFKIKSRAVRRGAGVMAATVHL